MNGRKPPPLPRRLLPRGPAPSGKKPGNQPSKQPARQSGRAAKSARSSRLRILVVDDDPDIVSLLKRALRGDYDVVTACDGPSAIALAGVEPLPALIVLDVGMPGMTGFEVAGKLKSGTEHKRTPIIFLTARDTPGDVIRGIQVGARSYLTKPFKLNDLLAKVSAALKR